MPLISWKWTMWAALWIGMVVCLLPMQDDTFDELEYLDLRNETTQSD